MSLPLTFFLTLLAFALATFSQARGRAIPSFSTEPIIHDARGNLVSDALWTYTWDANNRLIGIDSKPAAIAAGRDPVKLAFRYDWLGRRVMKEHFQHNGTSFSTKPGKVTLFWWDGWNLLREASYNVTWGAVNPTAASFTGEFRYHRGPDIAGRLHGLGGIGGLVAVQRREAGQAVGPPRYPAYDGNGNIVAMLAADGSSVAEFEYDPYGRQLRASGPEAHLYRIRFATQYHDAETGLYYHQFRYYDPGSARFLSRDPAGTSGNFHPYAYADNNPVDGVDAFGLAISFHASRPSSSIFSSRPGGSSARGGGGFSGVTVNVASNRIFSNALRRGLPSTSSRPAAASSHIGEGSGHAFDSRADLTVVSAAFGSPAAMDPRYSYRQLMELGQKEFRLEKDMIAGQILIAQIEGRSGSMQFGRLADELDKMGPGYESLAAEARGIQHSMQDGEFDYSIVSQTATGIGIMADLALVGVPPIFTAGKIGTSGIRAAAAGDDLVGIAAKTPFTPSVFARGQQGSGLYPGVDHFRDITLKKGTTIYGGTPGQSSFYTTGSAIRRAGDSATDIFQGLQVAPHPVHGYRPAMTAYEVIDDLPAAFGRTLANPQNGAGGLPQIVIPNWQGYLRPIHNEILSP